jgi:hypothetical protein
VTASIDWGDGHTSPGVLTPNSQGYFDITGSNTYMQPGTYAVTVTVQDPQVGTTIIHNSARILPLTLLLPSPTGNLGIVMPTATGVSALLGSNTADIAANIDFANSLYHTVLGRAPDQQGLNNCFLALEAGVSRFQISQGVWRSAEHRALEVEQFYELFLRRTPNPSETVGWVNVFLAGASENDIELAFLNSPEYQAAHADSASFVTGLYNDVLGRAPSANEAAGWEQALASGMSRSAVAIIFLTSAEYDLRVLDAFYGRLLDRNSDAPGEHGWLAFLRGGGAIETVAEQFLASDEYLPAITFLSRIIYPPLNMPSVPPVSRTPFPVPPP